MLTRFLGTSVVLHSAGLGLMFLAQLSLARVLGAQEFGIYAYANAWLMILVLIARYGCDITVLRFGGAIVAQRDWTRFASLMKVSGSAVLRSSAVMAMAMLIVSLVAARSRPATTASQAILVAALIIPVLALSGLRQAALLACGHVAKALTPEYIVRPLLIGAGALTMFVLWRSGSAPYAVAANLAATVAAYALGQYWLSAAMPPGFAADTAAPDRVAWMSSSISALLFSGAQQLLAQVDVIVGGALVEPGALGHYAASRQLASVGVLGLIAFQYSSSPRIAAAHAGKDFHELSRLLRAIAWGGVAFALLYGIALAIIGSRVLALFGKGFPDAQSALWVMLAGQVLVAAGGPAGTVASMVGLQSGAAVISAVAAIGCAFLAAAMSVRFGILGISLAVCLSMAAWNAGVNLLIYKREGFSVWVGSAFFRERRLRGPK